MYKPSRINSTHNSVSSSFPSSPTALLSSLEIKPVVSILLSPSGCFPPPFLPRSPYLTISPLVRANNSTASPTSFDAADVLINGDTAGVIFSLFVLVVSQISAISFTSSSDGKFVFVFVSALPATVETVSSKFGFTSNAYAESTCGCT